MLVKLLRFTLLAFFAAAVDARASSRIVGGTNSKPHPYYTYLKFSTYFKTSICGGTLIHEDVVMTAAHCHNSQIKSIKAYVNVKGKPGTIYGGEEIEATVLGYYKHAGYDTETNENDIMLLKLATPITSITPVNWNENHAVPVDDEDAQIFGLGTTQYEGSAPNYLQEATVDIVPNDICVNQYEGAVNPEVMLCAARFGKDTCQGDSGGPLVIQKSGEPDLQVGITSFGVGCASPDYSGVYTRVSSYTYWIKAGLCTLSGNPPSYCGGSEASDDSTFLISLGLNGCSPSNKCGRCKGDCDSDSDCAGNLKCFQRDDDTAVPGCNGNGTTTYDYCYDPADFGPSSSPVLVPVPSITPSTPRPSSQGSMQSTPTTMPVTPQDACYVCGAGNEVNNPYAVVTVPFHEGSMTCSELQTDGERGELTRLPCIVYSAVATVYCGCVASGAQQPPTEPPTSAADILDPTTMPTLLTEPPTSHAPISVAPVTPAPVTPAPISAAPVTPAPVTPAPVTPAPIGAAPVTPAPVSSAPVAQTDSSCRDFGNNFEVNDAVGSRDCGWLRKNFDRFSYLCRFVDVAYECRTLCDTCSYFEPRTLT